MRFVWDVKKAEINQNKHGISFDEALKVFDDHNRMEYYDIEHSQLEDRYITIGLAKQVLVVVYTERKDTIRIISARTAVKHEREAYYDYRY